MKTLYIDCSMGAAGDMLTAALLELLPDPDAFIHKLNMIAIPGVRFVKEKAEKCGIKGTHVSVLVDGEEEEEFFGKLHKQHQEEHEHSHSHHHTGMHEIEHIVEHMNIPEDVKNDVLIVYGMIAEAESHVHGKPVSKVHFHEVGAMDAIADITAVCMLMKELSPDEVVVSPVHVGSGTVECAHGILPVPAPATAYILENVPIYGGEIKGELCTPTGAALLKCFATRFDSMPVMIPENIGYGMGKRDFRKANCVRVIIGGTIRDEVIEFACNVDDMTAEEIGSAMDRLFEAGALDVYTVPIGMKKSRPGTMIRVMCKPGDREAIVMQIFKHTTTIGIREILMQRYVLDRSTETISTKRGDVRKKISSGYGVLREKYEHEDIARIARENDKSLREVIAEVERANDGRE